MGDDIKITRPSGDWLNDGFAGGDRVVRDDGDGGVVYIVTDITATTLTVVKATRWQRFWGWLKQRRRKR